MDKLGYTAGVLTLIAYFPQAIKTLRTGRSRDLSLLTYWMLTISASLWTIYGLGIRKPAIYITNGVVAILSLIILRQKISHSKNA